MQRAAPNEVREDRTISSSSCSALYTPLFCEENVYLLLQSLPPASYLRAYALFISNPARKSLLFHQRASTRSEEYGSYVVWDYHVVAVIVPLEGGKEKVLVLDRDSLLGMPVELEDYVAATFRPELFASGAFPELKSRIRIVPSQDFLTNFASDRSHMLQSPSEISPPSSPSSLPSDLPSTTSLLQTLSLAPPPPVYIAPPPPYPPLIGSAALARGETHNLWTRFLDIRIPAEVEEGGRGLEGFGVVLEEPGELVEWSW